MLACGLVGLGRLHAAFISPYAAGWSVFASFLLIFGLFAVFRHFVD